MPLQIANTSISAATVHKNSTHIIYKKKKNNTTAKILIIFIILKFSRYISAFYVALIIIKFEMLNKLGICIYYYVYIWNIKMSFAESTRVYIVLYLYIFCKMQILPHHVYLYVIRAAGMSYDSVYMFCYKLTLL